MKKKLVLLISTSLSTVMAVTSLLFVGKKANKFEFARGSGEPVAFSVDYNTLTPVEGEDNAYSVDLVNGKGARVGTRVKNVEMTETGFKPASADGSIYFYNVDPIRGISTSAFYVNGPEYGSYTFIGDAFLSKNAIDIDDVLDSKYADLKYQSFYCSCNGMYAMQGNNSNMPGLNECRYFFMNIVCDEPDFRFLGMEFESVCQDEIYPDPIGDNYGVLTEEEKATVNYLFGNSFSLDQTGNGAWGITYCYSARHEENGLGIAQCVESGEKSEIITALEDCGYTHTYSETSQDFYQKQDGGVTHTVLATKYEYTLFDKYEFYYTDEYPFIDTRTSWPSDILEANFSAAHCAEILAVEGELVDSYQYATQAYNTMSMVYIVVNLVDTVTEEEAATLLNTINAYYSTGNWHYSEIADRYFNDPVFSVMVDTENEGKVITLRFIEDNPTIDPPSASDIAASLRISALQVPAITGNANSRYSVQSEPGSEYFIYYIYYQTSTDLENVKTFLVNSGFTLDGSMDIPYPMAQYRKQVDAEGTIYYINLSLIEGAIYVVHHVYRPYSLFTNIRQAFSYQFGMSSYELDMLFDSVSITGSYNYFCSNMNSKVVVRGAKGSSLVGEITASSSLEYIAPYDAYMLSGMNYAFTFIESGDDIIIQRIYISSTTFYSYTDFNSAVTSYFGESHPESLILFEEEDNLIQGFEDPYNSYRVFRYHAPSSEVNRVYDIYVNRLVAAGFVYSNYLDLYVNPTTQYAYEVKVRESSGSSYLEIDLSNISYQDYDSYNNLNIGDSVILSYFPALISSSDYDKKMFVNPYEGAEYFSVAVSNGFDLEAYCQALINDGYQETQNNGSSCYYGKLDGGCVYQFSANSFGRGYDLSFKRYAGFGSAAALLTSIENETCKNYLISLGFSECFTSEGTAYRLENVYNDHFIEFSALNDDEIQDFKDYLLNHGFTYDNTSGKYVRNVDGAYTTFDTVEFQDMGVYCRVIAYQELYSYLSWSDIESSMESGKHPYHTISNYVPYPDDASGNSYILNYSNEQEVTIRIKKDYDITSYLDELVAATGKKEKESYNEFYFEYEYGYVRVSIYDRYIEVNIYSEVEFLDIASTPTVVSLGTTPFTATSQYTVFEFTPTESGTYIFTTDSSRDTYGALADEDAITIESDDDSGDSNNFLIEQYLEAGTTYYIGARLFSYGEPAEANLVLTKVEEI